MGKKSLLVKTVRAACCCEQPFSLNYLVLAERVNDTPVDASDGDPQNKHNYVLGYSCDQRVSMLYNHRHVCG